MPNAYLRLLKLENILRRLKFILETRIANFNSIYYQRLFVIHGVKISHFIQVGKLIAELYNSDFQITRQNLSRF